MNGVKACFTHTVQTLGHAYSCSESGACTPERCSPPAAPFPPQPPREVAFPCSAGSQVLRRSPTSPARTCPSCGYMPSRTGLRKTAEGVLEISRFSCMLFHGVRGLYRLRRTGQPLASNAAAVLPSSYSSGSRHPDLAFFEAQSPRPPMPRSTLRNTPRDVPRKTRGQDGVAFSFPVGLLHPLQHAGLSRRSSR